MTNQWKCPQCGNENPDAMRFCPSCGEAKPDAPPPPIAEAAAPAAPAVEPAVAPQKNRRMLWIGIIAVWLLGCAILIVGGGIWLGRQSSDKSTLEVAAAATSTPAPSSCPAPGVQITSPRSGARFTRRNNFIIGTANINGFHHWKVEYSTDPNGGWQYLLERDYPVDNDKLVMIDAKTIPRGPYGLRLTVVDASGNYPEPCVVWYTNGY
ncbi:MAG TPA: zinc ribbon domain-containing protein [Chloroflexi bacterium]|nr:zinc ribbon domain-containing protein [Chloroflexota bacterium]